MSLKNRAVTTVSAALLVPAAVVGAPFTMNQEGLKLQPYYDSAGVKTVCIGETKDVEDRAYTEDECVNMYGVRYGWFSHRAYMQYNDVAKSVITPAVHAAMTDMAYNIGVRGFSRSGMLRNLNAGRPKVACDYILRYKYITRKGRKYNCSTPGNKVCYGLWDRRLKTHAMCVSGLHVNA